MSGVTLALVGAGLRGQSYARHAVERGHGAGGRGGRARSAPPGDRRGRVRHPRRACRTRTGPSSRRRDGWPTRRSSPPRTGCTPTRPYGWPTWATTSCWRSRWPPSEREASEIADAARRNGIIWRSATCCATRPTPGCSSELLDEGRIGRLVSVQHLEPVGWWHHAHSFVRGNWRRQDASAPMLLAKSCHDIDWLVHLFGEQPARVSLVRQPDPLPGRRTARPARPTAASTARSSRLPVLGEAPLPGCLGDPAQRVLAAGRGHRRAHRGGVLRGAAHRARTAAASTPATTTSSTTRW